MFWAWTARGIRVYWVLRAVHQFPLRIGKPQVGESSVVFVQNRSLESVLAFRVDVGWEAVQPPPEPRILAVFVLGIKEIAVC